MLGLEGGWRGWKLAKLAEQEGAWSLCFGGKSIFFHTQWMTLTEFGDKFETAIAKHFLGP